MALNGLPRGDLPSLRLVHPTEKEKVEQWSKNGASWKGALSLDAYQKRERHLLETTLAKDGGITHWVLVDSDARDRRVLSGCETLRKKALIAQNGKVIDVVCHSIGSVFCPPEFRGKGYSQRMMRELGPRLETWQTDNAPSLFSVLFSDIGKQFYAKNGWHPFPSAHVSIPATKSSFGNKEAASPLYATELAELCKADEKLIRRRLELFDPRTKPSIAIIPDVATIQWHHTREEFVATELYGKAPVIKGAIVGTEMGRRVWCYWARAWYNEDRMESEHNTLYILRLVIEDETATGIESAIASLLRMALNEAQEWHMGEIQVWNPTEPVIAAAKMIDPQVTVVHREETSIPSLRWHGNINDPDSKVPATDQCDWISNEKYGWC